MAAIDSTKKSGRFLQSRRYTHDTFTDAQEAFTSVLDINASEIYIDHGLIPSSGLPYNSSGQDGSIYSSSGQQVMKYYYRQTMTKSDTNNEVWFFLVPTGSTSGVGASLINASQQTNFISPKYSISSLANSNTEDATPGYGVKVLINGVQQSVNNYAFDYKTGVLQFVSTAVAPTSGQVVTISAYQYVGRTLKDSLDSLGSAGIFTQTGSYYSTTNDIKITGSLVTTGDLTVEGTLTAKTLIISSSVTNMVVQYASGSTSFGDTVNDNHNFTGSVNITGSLTINGQSFSAATSGTSGTSGSGGSSGTSGSDGSSGSSGTSGSSGSSGTSGSSGSAGTSGTSGSSGISGVNGSDGTSGTSGDSIFAQTGSAPYDFWATSKNVQITGSLITTGSVIIRGDLTVEGTTTLNQKNDLNRESLIVSGALNIVERRVNTTLTSASLYFNNELSIINNTISNLTFPGTFIDSGEF